MFIQITILNQKKQQNLIIRYFKGETYRFFKPINDYVKSLNELLLKKNIEQEEFNVPNHYREEILQKLKNIHIQLDQHISEHKLREEVNEFDDILPKMCEDLRGDCKKCR